MIAQLKAHAYAITGTTATYSTVKICFACLRMLYTKCCANIVLYNFRIRVLPALRVLSCFVPCLIKTAL